VSIKFWLEIKTLPDLWLLQNFYLAYIDFTINYQNLIRFLSYLNRIQNLLRRKKNSMNVASSKVSPECRILVTFFCLSDSLKIYRSR